MSTVLNLAWFGVKPFTSLIPLLVIHTSVHLEAHRLSKHYDEMAFDRLVCIQKTYRYCTYQRPLTR